MANSLKKTFVGFFFFFLMPASRFFEKSLFVL